MTQVDENLELIENYIQKLKWSDDTPDIHKTLVAGNIRAFYAWARPHLTLRAGDVCKAHSKDYTITLGNGSRICSFCGRTRA